MTGWTQEELAAVDRAKDLYISIPNEDGTMHKPTWIWAVRSGDDVYARGFAGTASRWYVAAKAAGHGHILVGGIEKDVTFEFPADAATNDPLDKIYPAKYADSPYANSMSGETQRAATVRFIPDK